MKVRCSGEVGQEFELEQGVRQGCVLSPLMFLLALEIVLEEANVNAQNGIRWNMFSYLDELAYADDIVIMAHTLAALQDKVDKLLSAAKRVGLNINVRKTKTMRVMSNNVVPIRMNNVNLDDVDQFTYLGAIVSNKGGSEVDIAHRIGKARNTFNSLYRVWRSSSLARPLKLRIFDACVISVLLYGCESWGCTASVSNSLQVFINKCLRRIMNIYYPVVVSNTSLWAMAGNRDPVLATIKQRRWRWIGHILRRDNEDVTKQALEWNPQGSRRRGRPCTTWRRTITTDLEKAGKSWGEMKNLASNRILYRNWINAQYTT